MGNIPAGYVPLGLVGFTDQGAYDPDEIYMENDLIHVSNAIWKCKVDNTQGIAPEENANWTIFINSTTGLAGIAAVDEKGVLGSPGGIVVSQSLIDAIAQKVMEDLVPYSKIVNNLLSTDIRTALSGPMGKKLADDLASLNSEILIGEAVYGPFTFPHGVSYYDVKILHVKEGYNIISANITTLGVPTYRVSLGITLYLIDDINLGIRIDNADPNTLESHIAVQFVFKRAK